MPSISVSLRARSSSTSLRANTRWDIASLAIIRLEHRHYSLKTRLSNEVIHDALCRRSAKLPLMDLGLFSGHIRACAHQISSVQRHLVSRCNKLNDEPNTAKDNY